MNERGIRRMAGYALARLPETGLEQVSDPRRGRTRWRLEQLLQAVVVGMMAGCCSLHELERLTKFLSPAMRQRLGLSRRLPDTTARDALCRVDVGELRGCLHRLVRAAGRRKALNPSVLPFGVVALDGKGTALPCWDERFVQKHHPESGLPFGIARTVTCTLISAAGRPCIDAIPIPAATNEMGWFQQAFDQVSSAFPGLFRMVTYDAGALSEANARHVVEAGKDYLLHVKGEQRTMFKLADELLEPNEFVAATVDKLDRHTTVTRRLALLTVQQQWAYGQGKGPAESVWQHARTFLRVESVLAHDGQEVSRDARTYVSSLEQSELTGQQWLRLVRSHWSVEVTHNTLDTALLEDDRPWIVADGNGMMVALLLRRIAYTLLTLFRSVSLRSDALRAMRWKDLLDWVHTALVAATEDHLAELRSRKLAVCS